VGFLSHAARTALAVRRPGWPGAAVRVQTDGQDLAPIYGYGRVS